MEQRGAPLADLCREVGIGIEDAERALEELERQGLCERYLDAHGQPRVRIRAPDPDEPLVLVPDHAIRAAIAAPDAELPGLIESWSQKYLVVPGRTEARRVARNQRRKRRQRLAHRIQTRPGR